VLGESAPELLNDVAIADATMPGIVEDNNYDGSVYHGRDGSVPLTSHH